MGERGTIADQTRDAIRIEIDREKKVVDRQISELIKQKDANLVELAKAKGGLTYELNEIINLKKELEIIIKNGSNTNSELTKRNLIRKIRVQEDGIFKNHNPKLLEEFKNKLNELKSYKRRIGKIEKPKSNGYEAYVPQPPGSEAPPKHKY